MTEQLSFPFYKNDIAVPGEFISALRMFQNQREALPRDFQLSALVRMRGLRLEIYEMTYDEASGRIELACFVPDRDEPSVCRALKLTGVLKKYVAGSVLSRAEHLYEQVHEFVVQSIAHEVTELLVINGRRLDPHEGEVNLGRWPTKS